MVINKISTSFENQYNKYLSQSGSLFLINKKIEAKYIFVYHNTMFYITCTCT